MREKGIKAEKLDEDEWDALKQAYLQKKAGKPEKLDDEEYEHLKEQYIKEKGIEQLSLEAEDYEAQKEEYLKKRGAAAEKKDSQEYDELKQQYLERKGLTAEQPGPPDYDELKQKYMERKTAKPEAPESRQRESQPGKTENPIVFEKDTQIVTVKRRKIEIHTIKFQIKQERPMGYSTKAEERAVTRREVEANMTRREAAAAPPLGAADAEAQAVKGGPGDVEHGALKEQDVEKSGAIKAVLDPGEYDNLKQQYVAMEGAQADGLGEQEINGPLKQHADREGAQQPERLEDQEYELLKQQYLEKKGVQEKQQDADDYEAQKQQYLNRQSKKAEQQDSDEYEKLKQEYIEKKGIQKDRSADEEYEELKRKYIERKGLADDAGRPEDEEYQQLKQSYSSKKGIPSHRDSRQSIKRPEDAARFDELSEIKHSNELVIQMDSNTFFNKPGAQKQVTPKADGHESSNLQKSGSFAGRYAPHAQNKLEPSVQVEHSANIEPALPDDTHLKKRKIEQNQAGRHHLRLDVRNQRGEQNSLASYKSDLNIKLKYYGEGEGYEIKLEDDVDDSATLSGHEDPHLEQDTVVGADGIREQLKAALGPAK